MNRLVLIDGNAIIHRAFHALPPLSTKDGQPINAVYGFTSMLLRVIQDLTPTYVIVVFDRPEPTFRKKLFKEYQSHRPKMDEGLASQFSFVKKVVETMHIPIFEKAGYEADDVIGTLARQVTNKIQNSEFRIQNEKRKIDEVVIVTGDRDILQLVTDHVKVYMPVKGLSEAKLYGEEDVIEKFGLPPMQIPDYKGLVGDPSDNYPGVNGIGPKTAITLLNKFKTVEGLYAAMDKKKWPLEFVPERVIGVLKHYRDDAFLSKKLATIVCDVPLTIDLSRLTAPITDSDDVVKLFEQFEFHSLMKRLMIEGPSTSLRVKKENGKRKEKKDKKEDDNQLSLL